MAMRSHVVVLAVVVLATGCGKPANDAVMASFPSAAATDAAAVQSTIDSLNRSFIQTLRTADTAALTRNYAPDAVVMMPNEAAWAGEARIRQGLLAFVRQMTLKDAKFRTQSLLLSGDMAVETGSYEWTLQPKAGKAMQDRGKYLTVWKKQADGSWKIVRDINNSDLAAQ